MHTKQFLHWKDEERIFYLQQLHRWNQKIHFRFSDLETAHRFCYFLLSLTNIFNIFPTSEPPIFSVTYISPPLIKKIFKELILADINATRIKIQCWIEIIYLTTSVSLCEIDLKLIYYFLHKTIAGLSYISTQNKNLHYNSRVSLPVFFYSLRQKGRYKIQAPFSSSDFRSLISRETLTGRAVKTGHIPCTYKHQHLYRWCAFTNSIKYQEY